MNFSSGARAGFRSWARFSAAAVAMLATSVIAQTLYATTVRRYVGPSELGGVLYVVDPKTAKAKLVGPLRIPGLRSVGVTGLAVHPRTKVLYGITAGLTPELRPSLITIDPKTAEVKLVGPLGLAGTDINFDAKGNLFVWLADSNELGKINVATGAATPIGPSGLAGAGGGLAIDRKGTAYVAANTAAGTLDIVDTRTGAGTLGPALSGAPYLSEINSLTFSPEGELFAVNSNLAAPAKTALVVINTGTGVVSIVGDLPDDADGLTFSPDASATGAEPPAFAWIWTATAIVGILVFAALALRRLRRAGER
jgi:DNA-binding beta-propeller fold protein YncE